MRASLGRGTQERWVSTFSLSQAWIAFRILGTDELVPRLADSLTLASRKTGARNHPERVTVPSPSGTAETRRGRSLMSNPLLYFPLLSRLEHT